MRDKELKCLEREIEEQKKAMYRLASSLKLEVPTKPIPETVTGKNKRLEHRTVKSVKELDLLNHEQVLEHLKLRRMQLKSIVNLVHDRSEKKIAKEFLRFLDSEINSVLREQRRLEGKSIFTLLISYKLGVNRLFKKLFISNLKRLTDYFKRDKFKKKTQKIAAKRHKARIHKRDLLVQKQKISRIIKQTKHTTKLKKQEFIESVKDSAVILRKKHASALKDLDKALDDFIEEAVKTPKKFLSFFVKKKKTIKRYPHPKLTGKDLARIKQDIRKDIVHEAIELKNKGKSRSQALSAIQRQGYPEELAAKAVDLVFKNRFKKDILFEIKK